MTLFPRLQQVLDTARQEQDLPDYLAEQIKLILSHPESFNGLEDRIEQLIEEIDLYDTYGQTGYMGMGVSNLILEKSLQRLLAEAGIDNPSRPPDRNRS